MIERIEDVTHSEFWLFQHRAIDGLLLGEMLKEEGTLSDLRRATRAKAGHQLTDPAGILSGRDASIQSRVQHGGKPQPLHLDHPIDNPATIQEIETLRSVAAQWHDCAIVFVGEPSI